MMQVLKNLLPNHVFAALLVAIAAVGFAAPPASAGNSRESPRGRPHDPIFQLPPLVLQPWNSAPRFLLHTVQEGGGEDDDDSGIRPPGFTRPMDDVFAALDDLPLISDGLFDQPPSFESLRMPSPQPWPAPADPGLDLFGSTGQTLDAPPAGAIPGPGAWPLLALALARRRRRRR